MSENERRVTRIGTLALDAAITETHERTASATKHPVESGADITDHVKVESSVFSVEGIVTDTPIGQVRNLRGTTAADDSRSFAAEARAYLVKIFTDKTLVEVQTTRETFRNMVCTNLSESVDSMSGRAFRFNATFEEIRIVENLRTRIRTSTRRPRNNRGHRAGITGVVLNAYDKERARRIVFAKNAKTLVWRKGRPPGAPLSTTGDGRSRGYESEVVHWGKEPGWPNGRWYHADRRTPLTAQEVSDLNADMQRDRIQGISSDPRDQATKSPAYGLDDTPTDSPKWTPIEADQFFAKREKTFP